MAWQMAEAMSRQLNFSFIAPTLNCDKPQMKQLTVEDKIAIWKEIYDNNNVVLNNHVRGKILLWWMICISQVQQFGNMQSI